MGKHSLGVVPIGQGRAEGGNLGRPRSHLGVGTGQAVPEDRAFLGKAELVGKVGEEHRDKRAAVGKLEELILGKVALRGIPEEDTVAVLGNPVEGKHQGKLVVAEDRDKVEELHLEAFDKLIDTEALQIPQWLQQLEPDL